MDAEFIREKIFKQEIPYCEKCQLNNINHLSDSHQVICSNSNDCDELEVKNTHMSRSSGILKPDIVFFGEGLPEHYHKSINEDKSKCDLLIVIGSSLKVKPVANIPRKL